jgi:hypothetical protein
MRANHVLSGALLVGAVASGCSDSGGGSNVEPRMLSWTDNGTRHSIMAPQAALVVNPLDSPPLRTFFITTAVDAQLVLNISIHMTRKFATGDYHCESATDAAEITYGLANEARPPGLQACLVTVDDIGVNHGGVVDYTEGTFSGTIVIGAELHDLTDGEFSAPTAGLASNQ